MDNYAQTENPIKNKTDCSLVHQIDNYSKSTNSEMPMEFTISAPDEYKRIRIHKWRVREGVPIIPFQVLLLYEVLDVNGRPDSTLHKLKACGNRVGVVKKLYFKDGEIVNCGVPMLEVSRCLHTTVIKDMCADCGADLRHNENGCTSEASVPMVHTMPDLKVSQNLAQKLGHDDTRRLLQDRKLVLLVDLDQTIIHTTNDIVPNNVKGIYHFQLYGAQSPWYHTRLRPGTPDFLENISEYYELHICTFGARNYAHMIAQLLDPEGKYFSHRILSRDECFNATSKTDNLKALFPNGDSMVCIIDDREDVWNMASNLIQVKPYHFFQHTGDINAPPGLSKNELDGKGVDFNDRDNETKSEDCLNDILVENNGFITEPKTEIKIAKDLSVKNILQRDDCKIINEMITTNQNHDNSKAMFQRKDIIQLKSTIESAKNNLEKEIVDPFNIEDLDDYLIYLKIILKNIHKRFYTLYDQTNEIPDLKHIVPQIRSEVLRGSQIVFSGLVPTNMKLEQSRAYFIAKSLGANVLQNIGPETTHVVAVTAGTYKVNTAKKKPGVHIVNANWLWTCAERWEHVDEKCFPLDSKVKSKSRQPPAHCHSPEHVVNYTDKSEIVTSKSPENIITNSETEKFIDTINPLLSFSNDDLDDMNKEFDQFFESDSSSDGEHVDIGNTLIDKQLRKRKREDKESQNTNNFFSRTEHKMLMNISNNIQSNIGLYDSKIFIRKGDKEKEGAVSNLNEEMQQHPDIGTDSKEDTDSSADSAEGDWIMMGEALEREFLGLDKADKI